MWLFGIGRKQDSSTSQPVQREISIRTRDGIDEQGESVTLLGETRSNGYVTTTTTTSRLVSSFRQTLNNSFSGFLFRGDSSSAGGRGWSLPDDESVLGGNDGNLNDDGANQEDEDNSDSDSKSTSSSLSGTKNSGNREGTNNGRIRNRSYLSYNREPLDVRVWSSVTSPGFTSRAVQQANGNGVEDVASKNLRTFTGGPTINRASMNRSPNLSLRLGELPTSTSPRRKTSAMINFPSPNKSSFSFNRFSRVHKRDVNGAGTIFVKLAPVDLKGLPVAPIQNSGLYSYNNYFDWDDQQQYGSYGPSMGILGGEIRSNSPTSPGLGGIPLAQRFSRLGWPDKYPYPGTSNGPEPPSTGYMGTYPIHPSILDAGVMHNRKRGRDLDGSVHSSTIADPIDNRAGPSNSTPKSFTSSGNQNKFTKKVKYLTGQDIGHPSNRFFLNYDVYRDPPTGNNLMTSKSILEQTNQKEKRFFPDVSPITSAAKRTKLSTNTPLSGIRKRKVGENGISIVEVEDNETAQDPKSKTGKFCHCNECYAEAAGISTQNNNVILASPPKSSAQLPRKTVTFEASPSSKMNTSSVLPTYDHMEMTTPEIIIRRATQPTLITKEKYDYDRKKRIERFKRILGLEPTKPAEDDQQPMDEMDGNANKISPLPTLEAIPPTPATSTISLSQLVTGATTTLTYTASNNDYASSSTIVSEAPKVTFGAANLIPASNSVGGTSADAFDAKSIQFIQPKLDTKTTELIKNEGTGGFSFGSQATTTVAEQSTMPPLPGSAPAGTISLGGFSSTPTTTSAPATTNNNSFGGFSSAVPTTSAPTSVFGSGTEFGAAAPTTTTTASFGGSSANAAPLLTFGNNNQNQVQASTAVTTTSGFNFGQSTTITTTTSAPSSSAFSLGGGQNSINSITPSNILESLTPSSSNTTTNNNNISGFGSSTFSSSVPAFGLSAPNPISQPFGGGNSTTTTTLAFGSSAATNSNSGFGAVAPQATTPYQFGQTQSQPASANGGFNFEPVASAGEQQPPAFQFGGMPQASADQQPAQQFTTPSIFGSAPAATNNNASLGGFSSAPTSTTTSAPPAFGSTTPMFGSGGGSIFGSTASPASINPSSSVFGSVNTTTGGFGDANQIQTTSLPTTGGFNFGQSAATSSGPSFPLGVTNPIANNNNTSGFGFPSSVPAFGLPASSPISQTFGGGGNLTTPTPAFGTSAATNTSSAATPQIATPFPFGQAQPQSAANGGFNFESATAGTQQPPVSQFGGAPQAAGVGLSGGFNFASQAASTTPTAPSPGGNMFNLGQATAQPRRRPVQRRYR
ncbi:mucin-5AC isoform X1 [Folsomia candida]|uniref:mucin-5AC isoform X1 n=1 Tax=Folsomia candida TaxID=158441 RepID=UPI000B8EF365|nr:mucin-5AC isoform X1 [Folsomia candida]